MVLVLLALLQLLRPASGFCPQRCECVNSGARATVSCPPESDLEVIFFFSQLGAPWLKLQLVQQLVASCSISFFFFFFFQKCSILHTTTYASSKKKMGLLARITDQGHLSNNIVCVERTVFNNVPSLRNLHRSTSMLNLLHLLHVQIIPITLNPSIRELDLVGNRIRAVDASFQFYGQLERVRRRKNTERPG